MPARKVAATDVPAELAAGLAALRARLEIPASFPAEVLKAAELAAASPRLPDRDCTDLELITIDPEGSRDLDQALHIARDGAGYVISYAIADVAAFVTAGDPIDVEAASRGVTLYAPDGRTPLHPPGRPDRGSGRTPGRPTRWASGCAAPWPPAAAGGLNPDLPAEPCAGCRPGRRSSAARRPSR
jgi:hypothetical protein